MAILSPSNLETMEFATQGWDSIHDDNMEDLNTKIGTIIDGAASVVGSVDEPNNANSLSAPSAITAENLTDSTTGTVTNTINDVGASFSQTTLNDNFASLTDEVNKLKADADNIKTSLDDIKTYLDGLQTTLNNTLGLLRISTGVGLFDN